MQVDISMSKKLVNKRGKKRFNKEKHKLKSQKLTKLIFLFMSRNLVLFMQS